jgi:hypothetical protein
MAIESGSSPVAHGMLQMRIGFEEWLAASAGITVETSALTPLRRRGRVVVLEQIVKIQERPEPALEHQRRDAIDQRVGAAVVVEEARPLVNEIAQERKADIREAEVVA